MHCGKSHDEAVATFLHLLFGSKRARCTELDAFLPPQIKACIPEKMSETVMVEIAHFEPTPVQVVVDGVYATVLCSLPRVKDSAYKSALESAKEK
jgi:hypothetical protein